MELKKDSDLNSETGRIWYLPQFGVTYQTKPGKLRILCGGRSPRNIP